MVRILNEKDLQEIEVVISNNLDEAKEYADSVKNDLLNGAGAAYDTLKELGELINENNNAIDALETVASGKADKEHTHNWKDVENTPFENVASGTLTWDGNTEDHIVVDYSNEYANYHICKVSDAIITLNDCKDGITIIANTNEKLYYSYEELEESFNEVGFVTTETMLCIPSDNFYIEILDVTFPEAGIYFVKYTDDAYVKSMTIHSYTGFTSEKLKKSYLPEMAKPDFAQNDSTADDYIQNRTHWMEYELEELLTSVTVDINEYGEGVYETNIILVEGEKYVVEFEDKSYICTAKTSTISDDTSTITYIGKDVMTNGINSNDYPFTLGTINIPEMADAMIIAMFDMSTGEMLTSTQFTFSLGHFAVKKVHKLDSRYIDSPDWSAKEGEAGHILNRTHYMYNNYILPLTTFEVNFGQVTLQTAFNFEEGKTYFVNYNGVEYECVASRISIEDAETVYIGDITMSNPPFVIVDAPENAGADFKSMINIGDGSEQITISIYTSDFKKLDNRFLDIDWLPTMVDSQEEILPVTKITLSNSASIFNGLKYEAIAVGEKYVVNILGMSFTCEVYKGTVANISDCVFLGNPKIADDNKEDNNLPFFILIADDTIKPAIENADGMIIVRDVLVPEGADITLSISKIIKTPNKLPNEYLDMDWYASDVVKEEEIFSGAITSTLQIGLTPDMIEVGGTYTVCINSKQYETVAKSCEYYDGSTFAVTYLGNGALLNTLDSVGNGATTEQEDTGEDYCVVISKYMSTLIMDDYENVDSINLSISKITKSINKLPNKYLDLDWLPIMKQEEILFCELTTTNSLDNTKDITLSNVTSKEIFAIYYDGVRYECVAKQFQNNSSSSIIIGNLSLLNGGDLIIGENYPDTGEPFLFVVSATSSIIFAEEGKSISIYKLSDTLIPNKIPVEFLPDDISGSSITKVSELENDTGYITSAVSDLVNYYKKSETYSQEEINNKISAIPKFTISVVTALPTENISDTTVYLMTSGDETNNLYTEYIYANGKWEILGRQELDLSGKADKATTLAGYGITDGVTKYDLQVMHRNSYLVNGSNPGSLRSTTSAKEDDSYEIGSSATSFGDSTKASGRGSFVNGYGSVASGIYSYAEGWFTESTNNASHAEGCYTDATGMYSHAEGNYTLASGESSHAEGCCTIASGSEQHVEGRYNIKDSADTYAHIVGNGTKNESGAISRSNAHTLDWSGNAEFAGDVKANACGGENPISLIELYTRVQNLETMELITVNDIDTICGTTFYTSETGVF